MKVTGAGAKLGAAYRGHVETHQEYSGKPLFGSLMVVDYAVAASQEALAAAGLSATNVDLIVTASISPDHLSDDTCIMGPRLCHPLQRELGAHRAVVFDVHDACWVFALDVAQSFLQGLCLTNALVVRADCPEGVDPGGACGLMWDAGAGALVIRRLGWGRWRAAYKDLENAGAPARIELLDPARRFRGRHRAGLYFSPAPHLADAIATGSQTLAQGMGSARPRVETWRWDGNGDHSPQHGPYALPVALSQTRTAAKPDALVSFDPFRLRLGACPLELS